MDHCISCEKELIKSNAPYVIEKAIKPFEGFRAHSTVFEYAMCLQCAEKMRTKISTKSAQAINQYFSKNIDFIGRYELDVEQAQFSIEPWMDKCLVKGKNIRELGECQIYAQCQGDRLIIQEFPYMVSGQAIEEVMELISAETKDEFDRMKDELIDGPSEFQDLLQGGPRVFI